MVLTGWIWKECIALSAQTIAHLRILKCNIFLIKHEFLVLSFKTLVHIYLISVTVNMKKYLKAVWHGYIFPRYYSCLSLIITNCFLAAAQSKHWVNNLS